MRYYIKRTNKPLYAWHCYSDLYCEGYLRTTTNLVLADNWDSYDEALETLNEWVYERLCFEGDYEVVGIEGELTCG